MTKNKTFICIVLGYVILFLSTSCIDEASPIYIALIILAMFGLVFALTLTRRVIALSLLALAIYEYTCQDVKEMPEKYKQHQTPFRPLK